MIETIYFGLVLCLTLMAMANWRIGLYLAIFMDVARDPIRKLSDSQSVWLTVGGVAIWGGVFLGALLTEGAEIRNLFRRYRRLPLAMECLLLALIPGCILSVMLYSGGYKLALIGTVSYIAPMTGIMVGFLLPVREHDIDRVFKFYTVVNSIALIGTVAEYLALEHRVLGGIDMDWVRYRQGYVVQLISGVYRSPDIMGLHAAHVVVFSMILAHRATNSRKTGWLATAGWGMLCLLLSGRRKMLGIPLVFVGAYLVIGMLRGSRSAGRLVTMGALLAVVGGVALTASPEVALESEYATYASTLFTEGLDRSRSVLQDGVLMTLYQSGVLGSGIGSATQGAHYANVRPDKSWQEDGVSRLFKELGVPGVLLMVVFLVLFVKTIADSLSLIPAQHSLAQLQIAVLACVLANGASFIISHQQYSGDPGSAILVMLMLGMVLGLPRVYALESRRKPAPRRPVSAKLELATR